MRRLHKLCVVIPGPTFDAVREQIAQAGSTADLLEFRLDLFDFPLDTLEGLIRSLSLPYIFTLRSRKQGGKFSGTEKERLDLLWKLSRLGPDYIDLELDMPSSYFSEHTEQFPKIKIICSWHSHEGTPADLPAIYKKMRQRSAHVYKLSTMSHRVTDSLRMLELVKANGREGGPLLCGMCMGEYGYLTRVLGPVFGNYITFASLEKTLESAPGQVCVKELLEIYNHRTLNKQTKIFGLIGNPVTQSQSHITHNATFRKLGLDAVYVKMHVQPDELKAVVDHARSIGFQGLSVTIPYKEDVLAFLSEAIPNPSCNTLKFCDGRILGFNTDGKAVLELIEQKTRIAGKRVVILGAGGTAKAIAYELHQGGAHCMILNRSVDKARALAVAVNGVAYALDEFPKIAGQGYDILINATSVGMEKDMDCCIDERFVLPHRIVIDVVSRSQETALVKAAKKRQCVTINGSEMFDLQGAKQLEHWFGPLLPYANF